MNTSMQLCMRTFDFTIHSQFSLTQSTRHNQGLPMQRRNFIRLMSGGFVAANAVTLAGCSTDFPAEAVAAWQGPGAESDVRRWALGYAILSPNSHNRQPWLVDFAEPNAITLQVDRDRMLPMTDPWFRQIMVSQGTFLEALVLALQARGLAPTVQLFPQGEFKPREVDERPVARIAWPATQPTVPSMADPLFAQVLRRHTAKVDYDTTRPVDAKTLRALQSALIDPGIAYDFTVDANRLGPLRALCFDSAKVELQTPRTVMESAKLTRVGPAEIAQHRDGISLNGLMPRFANFVGAFDRTTPPAQDSSAMKQMMGRFEGHSRTAMGFVWLSTPTARHAAAGTQRSAEVMAGRAYMRLQLKATELGLQVHPMSQAPQEFLEMKPFYDRMHTLLVGQPADVQTVQMFCRVGYCTPQQHTPRRALAGFVKT
jgi:hypothetical protein